MAAVRDDDASADHSQPHRARGHVVIVYTKRDDVVRVVGHGRREGATFEPHVGRKAKADAPARVMALDDCDLDEVTPGSAVTQPSLTVGSTTSTPVISCAGMTRMTRILFGPTAIRKEVASTGATVTVCRTHSGTSRSTKCGGAPRLSTRRGRKDLRSSGTRMSAW